MYGMRLRCISPKVHPLIFEILLCLLQSQAWLLFMFYFVIFFFFFFLVSRPGFIRRSFVYYSFSFLPQRKTVCIVTIFTFGMSSPFFAILTLFDLVLVRFCLFIVSTFVGNSPQIGYSIFTSV